MAAKLLSCSDWRHHCPFNERSPPLLLPGGSESGPAVLPLFKAVPASGSSSSNGSLGRHESLDFVLNAGGPVWAMDWCPADVTLPTEQAGSSNGSSLGARVQYLAVGSHPWHAQANQIGRLVKGRCVLQLWEVSHPLQAVPHLRLPHLALALAHDGGLAWHCRWCACPELADRLTDSSSSTRDDGGSGGSLDGAALPRLGLLAAALGDGSLRVWSVPQPNSLRQRLTADQPPVVSLQEVALLGSECLTGSLPAVVEWLPAPPHDLLLVGCWDGTVAVLRLLPAAAAPLGAAAAGPRAAATAGPRAAAAAAAAAQGGAGDGAGAGPSSHRRGGSKSSRGSRGGLVGMELLLHFPAEPCPLRSVRWVPPQPCAAAADQPQRHVFLTAGHEGVLRVWDSRDQFQPLYGHTMSVSAAILGATWTNSPLGILVAMEDASLRGVLLDSRLIADNASRGAWVGWRGVGWHGGVPCWIRGSLQATRPMVGGWVAGRSGGSCSHSSRRPEGWWGAWHLWPCHGGSPAHGPAPPPRATPPPLSCHTPAPSLPCSGQGDV